MTQHYTRSTIETSAWCGKCKTMTQHTVSDRRLGYCIPCYLKPVEQPKPKPAPEPGLFGDISPLPQGMHVVKRRSR